MINFTQLRKLLIIANNLPVYSEKFQKIGLNTSHLMNINDQDLLSIFRKIKPIDKEELRQFPEFFLTQVDDIVYRGVTSGTTSEALIYFRHSQWNKQRILGLKKFLHWWNIDDNLPIININSRLFPLRENDYSIIGIIDNFFWESLKISTEKSIVIRGFPSRLCEVAMFAHKNIKISSVKAIISTGELLFPNQKQLLEDTFSAPIINEYGSQECGIYGFTCPICNNIHIDEKRCFVEVENQDLIVTDLYSETMPLIRYKNGDLAQIEKNNSCVNGEINIKILGRKKETIIPTKNYPIIPEINYYRTFLTPNKHKKIIGYVSKTNNIEAHNIKEKLEHILDKKDIIEYKQFLSPLDFYHANIINSESISSQGIKWNNSQDSLEKILDIINSRRWIFYNLPHSLHQFIDNFDTENNSNIIKSLKQDKNFLLSNILMKNNDDNFEINAVKLFLKYHNQHQLSLIYLDLLIIALFLEQKILWVYLKDIIIEEKIIFDSLSYRLLLTTISQSINNARCKKQPPLITKLTPLLPLFISDLDFCQIHGINYLPNILFHWYLLLNDINDDNIQDNTFLNRPLLLEKREIKIKNRQNIKNNLSDLSILNLEELKELGIDMVLFNLEINPSDFLDTIQQKLNNNQPQNISKKLGFIPFMRHLAKGFLIKGNRKKAYDCLLMSQDISLMQDDFESMSKVYNFKQKIM